MEISFYTKKEQTTDPKNIPLLSFLSGVQDGRWQDKVLKVRTTKDPEKQKQLKLKLPGVTMSGTFSHRSDKGLEKHSGVICLDIDNISEDLNEIKEKLKQDEYVFAVMVSCRGNGLAVLVKINPDKHKEAFEGLEAYFYEKYNIVASFDTSVKNVSRFRFVTYDPDLYVNEAAKRFTAYLKKRKLPPQNVFTNRAFSDNDIERTVAEICSRGVDITGDYQQWLEIGFAFAEHFGSNGFDLFNAVSQHSPKYDFKAAERQFEKCLKANGSKKIGIGTFFYYAKQHGIQVVSEKTKLIATITKQGKKSHQTPEGIAETIQKTYGYDDEETKQVIDRAFNSPDVNTDLTPFQETEAFILTNYNIKYNLITNYLEIDGEEVTTRQLNEMYIKVKNSGIDISYENMERVLLSPAIPEYHPIKDFFERHKKKDSRGHIAMLSKSIKTDTGGYDFVEDYLKRWFVGAVSMVYGKHSPLCLMLIGKTQNTGKTEFFRRILPEEIQSYYGESKWERGKDDEILMCQKWIILNDEYEGRTVDDEKKMKQLLSAQTFNIRAPYGRRHEDRKRIAALCATSNEENVLKDPTGNRRFIPIRILAIDHVIYNQVDKVKLWLEAYHLYKSGFDWEIRGEAQKKLEESTAEYNQTSLEAELIMKYYSPAEETEPCEMMTNSDIKVELEKKTNQRLSSRKIGLELVRLGFKKKVIKHYGTSKQVYFIQKNDDSAKTSDEQAPF